MQHDFYSGEQLLALCREAGCSISEMMQRRETTLTGQSRQDIRAEMGRNLSVMRESVDKGLSGVEGMSGLVPPSAARMQRYAQGSPLSGAVMAEAVAAAMAVVEVNASMGRIVAVPTAGASGILPGVLMTCARRQAWPEAELVSALFTAAAVGYLIARNATISGADGGCQAETGTGAAMTAAALVELSQGTPEQALSAAAMTLANVMGLVCDPVAGLVESPCIKRNALGAANALLSADMALAGLASLIPFDEVVDAMRRVGRALPSNLRETALGGLAATPTARRLARELQQS